MVRNFCQSCVHFDFTHLLVNIIQRFVIQSCSYYLNSYTKNNLMLHIIINFTVTVKKVLVLAALTIPLMRFNNYVHTVYKFTLYNNCLYTSLHLSTLIAQLFGAHYTCNFLLCIVWWTRNSSTALHFSVVEEGSISVCYTARY